MFDAGDKVLRVRIFMGRGEMSAETVMYWVSKKYMIWENIYKCFYGDEN